MAHIIGVDAGTSSLRSVLFDERGRALHSAQVAYAPLFPGEGLVEQRPEVWRAALAQTLGGVAAFARENGLPVGAIGLTSQRSSVFAVDSRGSPLCNAIMWHDKRSLPVCEALREREPWIYRRTGLRLDPMFSAPKMAWLRQHAGQTYQAAHKLLGVHEYLLHCLCGEFVTDYSLGGRTMMMALEQHRWDPELCALFGVDAGKLCRLVPQGSVCGGLVPALADACGLPAGLPVVSAGGDQQCAALGAGVTAPGAMAATTGTGSYVLALSGSPRPDGQMRYLSNPAALQGLYILECASPTAGNAYRWAAEQLLGPGGPDAVKEMDLLAAAAPAGANGARFLPYLKGRGAPEWDSRAKGALQGFTLATTRADIARAVLEGIALEVAAGSCLFRQVLGGDGALLASGGMTRFDLYNQIIADSTGHPVAVRDRAEATALGAWAAAAAAAGVWPTAAAAIAAALEGRPERRFMPDPRNAGLYGELMKERQVSPHEI